MPAKNLLRVSDKGTYSHIYNKGVENRLIFNEASDYEVFLGYLREYLGSPADPTSTKKMFTVNGRTFHGTPHQPKNYFNKVELIGYTLLPNHFHLVLHQAEQGAIESFLRSLSTRYSMYFNKKYQRQGSLFEGPYKSTQIPDVNKLVDFIVYMDQKHTTAKYSSHNDYIAHSDESVVKTAILARFLADAENNRPHTEKNYAELVKNHTYSPEEKSVLDKLMLENKQEPLQMPQVVLPQPTQETPKRVPSQAYIKDDSARLPEYFGLALGFVLLLGVGMWNVSVSTTQAKGTTSAMPDVSALVRAKASPTPAIVVSNLFSDSTQKEQDAVLAATQSATAALTETTNDPADLLFTPIQVMEGSVIVNIYSKPKVGSPVHRTAKEGENFTGAPVDLDWYEVRLDATTTGFIQSEYIKLRQTQ